MTEEQVLRISEPAVEMITSLRDQEPGEGEFALFIEVTGFRGSQFAYDLSFVPLADTTGEQLVERHGALAVAFPARDVEKLRGSSLALNDDGLAMENPNTPATPAMGAPAGDLTGPLAERVAQVLTEQVNPAIAMHGGGAELVSVDGNSVYLQLTGGCQGCGLATVTLHQGIERILREAIPEIEEVVDVTDHASGADPYYQQSKK